MKRHLWIAVIAVICAVAFLLVRTVPKSRPPEAAAPAPLSHEEIGALKKAEGLFHEGRLDKIEQLASEQPESRSLQLLAAVAKQRDTTGIINWGHPFPEAGQRAVSLNDAINSPQTPNEVLVTMLYDRSESTRALALGMIGQRKVASAVPRLIELAETATDNSESASAIFALAMIRDPSSIPILQKFVHSQGNSPELHDIVRKALKAMGASD